MIKRFAWSHSALTGFETCPKQHFHLRVAKDVSEAPSEAMLWGNRVHKALEDRIAAQRKLPDSLQTCEPLCQKFDAARKKGLRVLVEQKVCLNEDLELTGYFDRDAWLRCVYDVAVVAGSTANIYDWKTGKRKPDADQLKLFAGSAFAAYPDVDTVNTFFVWIKEKRVDKQTFYRAELSQIWQDFLPRVEAMRGAYDDQNFPEKPSGLCGKWCPVITCEHNGRRQNKG